MRSTLLLFARNEQRKLRNYLLKNFSNNCVICKKDFPLYLLECCHIKPRHLLNPREIEDVNNVMLLCRNCHKIYDNGNVGVNNSKIIYSKNILNYSDLNLKNYDDFLFLNKLNKEYYQFHFNNIFKK